MPNRRARAGAAILALAGGIAGVAYVFTRPVDFPIYLVPVGAAGHEESRRDVCAAWLPIARTQLAWSRETWIAVPQGGSLHPELRAARHLQFELDPGSGLADACVAEELDARTARDIVSAVLAACGRRDPPESQAILFLKRADPGGTCEKPVGSPTLRPTPSP
jgi:hypothetical protein